MCASFVAVGGGVLCVSVSVGVCRKSLCLVVYVREYIYILEKEKKR